MGSMNNWLAFSLSPQELQSSQQTHQDDHSQNSLSRLGFNSDEFSAAGTIVAAPPLNLPPPFGILEFFNTNNHHQSQDWNMKDFGMMNNSLLMGTNLETQEPKLENFLGRHFFSDHYHNHQHEISSRRNNKDNLMTKPYNITSAENCTFQNCSLQLPSNTNVRSELLNSNNNDIGGCDGTTLTSAQTLSLSMSTGGGGTSGGDSSSSDTNKQPATVAEPGGCVVEAVAAAAAPRKFVDTFGQRTSIYRGVTRHRWTGRYEAHLWDNSCRREGQTRKGRQVYLGGYDKEEKAARSYDLAALKYWGTATTTNFPMINYEKEIEEMKHMTRQEYVASLRRKSSGFSRGASIYRGVTRHHQHGRWQARIGRVAGNKDLYLGTFSTQEEAAEAYDIAAIKFRGLSAVTNFEMSRYDVNTILESSTLPVGGAAKRLKDAEAQTQSEMTLLDHHHHHLIEQTTSSQLTDGGNNNYIGTHHHGWPAIAFQQRVLCKQEQDSDSNAANRFHYHQPQLGNNSGTHNFIQPVSVLHNLMSLDSSSMEHSSGSNGMPMATVTAQEDGRTSTSFGDHNEVKLLGYHENILGSSPDIPYNHHARNMYYLSAQQSSACNNWVPTGVPMLAPPMNTNLGVCHGTSHFSV